MVSALYAAVLLMLTKLSVSWYTTYSHRLVHRRFANLNSENQRQTLLRIFSSSSSSLDSTHSSSNATSEHATESSSSSSIYHELKWLSQEIRRHDQLYYEESAELTDTDYDALVAREAQLCRQYPDLLRRLEQETGLGSSATRFGGRVGNVVVSKQQQQVSSSSRTGKRQHLQRMISLDNVNSVEELLAWLERVRKRIFTNDASGSVCTIVTEPKLDGLSLSLRYERDSSTTSKRRLVFAATRGDGTQGQDVTDAVSQMTTIPVEIDPEESLPDPFEVRGEVVLPVSFFANNLSLGLFSNARNAASGILLRKENDFIAKDLRSLLRFYAYDMVGPKLDGLACRQVLQGWGFTVPTPATKCTLTVTDQAWNETDVSDLLRYYDELQKHRERKESSMHWGDYDMDGCVHKVSEASLRDLLSSSNRAPRWAIAHKFPSQAAVTKLQSIDVQVGRTGALTPVAILEPIDLGGVVVRRATLHNFQHMRQVLGETDSIPKGSSVLVRRAGDVIPQVISRVDPENPGVPGDETISLLPPQGCPACGAEVIFDRSRKEEDDETPGPVLRCGGPTLMCPPRAALALQHAFSRDALDITGLSEARIRQLMDAKLLDIPSDLFELVSDVSKMKELEALEGWGPKSAQNLEIVAKRVASDGVSLSRFIYALGIRGIGVYSSSLLASFFGSVGSFLAEVDKASIDGAEPFSCLEDESESTKGIGPVLLSSLREFASEPRLSRSAHALARAVKVIESKKVQQAAVEGGFRPLSGKTVVFTGSMDDMTRSEAQMKAKEMGAIATPNTVSKSTDLVVVGQKGGKKADKANELGVKVISSDEFLDMVAKFNESTK